MAQLFFAPIIENGFARLDEEESRHLLTVLRRKTGDHLQLTDGKGFLYEAELVEVGKKHATARVLSRVADPHARPLRLHIALAPTKQIERFEWFLEKATEMGIETITPLLCKRSERETVRIDRLEKVLHSAMKQSLRGFLPQLNDLTPFAKLVKSAGETQKHIAWCAETPLPHLQSVLSTGGGDALILIGPEGDFTPQEVRLALDHGFTGVNLGSARLRTETAGLMAVAVANLLSTR